MQTNHPHFLLLSEAVAGDHQQWRFVLRSLSGDECLAAAEVEPRSDGGRLELLAVVRGLEALDQPSRVTLLTGSRYVSRGIRRGLSQWRDRQWRWERFGELVPIRDHDLWRRLDRALKIHEVQCYPWQRSVAQSARRATPAAAGRLLAGGTTFADCPGEAALMIVPRPAKPHLPQRTTLAQALVRLRQAVSASLAALWRPPLGRAA